ncbi:MAG: hypothetical protein QM820_35635 [Minicystis sp.]
MLRSLALFGALSLVLIPLLAGCTQARPPIEGWTGCLFENAARDMLHGETVSKPGAGSFVYVYTAWKLHPLHAEARMSELEIDFPAALSPGVTRTFSREGRTTEHERTAAYQERYGFLGSPILSAKTLSGSVRVIESDPQSASIAIDLTAPDLAIDDDKLGPVTLRGTVKARKVTSMAECRRAR